MATASTQAEPALNAPSGPRYIQMHHRVSYLLAALQEMEWETVEGMSPVDLQQILDEAGTFEGLSPEWQERLVRAEERLVSLGPRIGPAVGPGAIFRPAPGTGRPLTGLHPAFESDEE